MYEFIKDLLRIFAERVKSPYITTFIISWICWNWKFVFYMLLSDMPAHEKIAYSEKAFNSPNDCIHWLQWLIGPLLITILYPFFQLIYDSIYIKVDIKRGTFNYLRLSKEAENKIKLEISNQEFLKVKAENKSVEELVEKIEAEKKDKEKLIVESNKFKILNAKYGFDPIYKDVTELVNSLLAKSNHFPITNNTLGETYEGQVKQLEIHYFFNGQIFSIWGVEGAIVELNSDNKLFILETDESRKKLTILNKIKLHSFFTETWKLEYIVNTTLHTEIIKIDQNGYYYIKKKNNNFELTYILDEIQIDGKYIKFNKVDSAGRLFDKEELEFVNKDFIRGKKLTNDVPLSYTKISDS